MRGFLVWILRGPDPRPTSFLLGRWLFLRLLGVVFLVAFLSYWSQLDGLVGSEGILPAAEFLEAVEGRFGTSALWRAPTLAWLSGGDASLHRMLHWMCGIGTLFSLLLIADVAPTVALVVLWALYLSLVVVGQTFFNFQWDILLLETAFFAVFLAPLKLLPGIRREIPPSRLALFLVHWVLFKLMFLSGAVKILSGDTSWLRGSEPWALPVHYETQPIPCRLSWYAYHLPDGFHAVSLVVMFVIEILVPVFIFFPRRPRHAAALALIFLQVVIALTGNFTFFNLLTAALCVPLLDDRFLRALIPGVGRAERLRALLDEGRLSERSGRARKYLLPPVAAVLFFVSFLTFLQELVSEHARAGMRGRPADVPGFVSGFLEACEPWITEYAVPHVLQPISPFRTISGYGLFRVMTTERPEIILEGSNDGVEWKEYGFRWKPGAVDRAPGYVAPHQPRLDWQMWFAALNPRRHFYWLSRLMQRVLEGSEPVLGLLGTNPFPDAPPKYVRLSLYSYRFTDPETKRRTGAWWRRELKGRLTRPLSR